MLERNYNRFAWIFIEKIVALPDNIVEGYPLKNRTVGYGKVAFNNIGTDIKIANSHIELIRNRMCLALCKLSEGFVQGAGIVRAWN